MNIILSVLLPVGALGHGAVTFPRPRQSLDGDLPPWSNWSYPKDHIHFDESGKDSAGACPISSHSRGNACAPPVEEFSLPGKDCPNGETKNCVNGNTPYDTFVKAWEQCGVVSECDFIMRFKDNKYYLRRESDPDNNVEKSGISFVCKGHLKSNGQACYWFSNGCTIGCDECDGTHNQCGHGNQRFLYKGMNSAELKRKGIQMPPWEPNPGDMVLDPTGPQPELKHTCSNFKPKANATICSSRLRTYNTQAECGSAADFYFYSPWRAPGSAPVIDACGAAGGRKAGQGIGGAGASFQNSSLFRLGDIGSRIPPMPSQATWKAGSNVEVGWTVMANHGGGYSYRLAPLDSPLTEKAFQTMPLDFVGPSILRWDGDKSTQHMFDAFQVSEGTTPHGSQWRKNPIPTGPWEWTRKGPSFEPVCEESEACKSTIYGDHIRFGVCRCSGYSNGGGLLPNLEIVDVVKMPADLKPGRYVLGFRWDCEETDQVWQSCSDVTITSADENNEFVV